MPTTDRTAPPGRRAPRRPARSAVLAARRRERDRLPRYWFAHRLLLVLSGQRPLHLLLGHAATGSTTGLPNSPRTRPCARGERSGRPP